MIKSPLQQKSHKNTPSFENVSALSLSLIFFKSMIDPKEGPRNTRANQWESYQRTASPEQAVKSKFFHK